MPSTGVIFILVVWALSPLSGCNDESHSTSADQQNRGIHYTEEREPCVAFNPLRNLYFGDLHFHTDLSHDAWIYGVRSTPEEGYGFARGEPIALPPYDEYGHGTRTLQIDRPLDFAALTDHSEFLAETAYDRTSECSFTTFVGYEYTATTAAANLHRNVVFRNALVPDLPISYIEQPTAQKLWEALERSCREGIEDCDALVIPHNSNESNGNKFFIAYPEAGSIEEERNAAAQRARFEPLVEIFQNKGDSECMNGFFGVPGEPDELCDFEKLYDPPFDDCGDGTGFGGVMELGCTSRLDYVRNVLLAGLEEEERLGVNPYKLGIIAGTDTHNATPGAVAEDRFAGHLGTEEDTPEKRLGPAPNTGHSKVRMNPGGLTAVWADPEFHPDERAFYYARVVENPSCRWTAYECNRLPVEERPASCSDPRVKGAIQERAWTSPIWYRQDGG